MIKKITEYMEKNHMVQNGETLIVGVSGGADSVCLLSVLSALRESLGIRLICAHVNHMFRETAVRDEEYVQTLCRTWNVPCYIKRVDVAKFANERKLSFEEAGRKVRYAFFEELCEQYHGDKIAVAHNRNDCAETVLFHLFRGSHLKGLGGISPVSGKVIRPLLDVERAQIEAYLRINKLLWMEDETNDSTEYSRNYIRHEIVPAAEKLYPNVTARIAGTAEGLREAAEYLEAQTIEAMMRCCSRKDGGVYISIKELQEEHPAMVSGILYKVLEAVGGGAKDIARIHVDALKNLICLQAGRRIQLPEEICAHRTGDGILVRKEAVANSGKDAGNTADERDLGAGTCIALLSKKELDLDSNVEFALDTLGVVKARVFSYDKYQIIPEKTYTKWFDYDKIIESLVFRKRTEGDYLVINDAGNRKSLKEYFIQEKIPAYRRDEVWVLAEDSHVVWVPGHRISAFYKITDQTKLVLEITIGGDDNE